MPNYYNNPNVLSVPGYEIHFTRFADSIINDHFKDAKAELERILGAFYIDEKQIVEGGGGRSIITQNLAALIENEKWLKRNIESEHHVGGKVLTSESHEVDHYKSFSQGNLGLEIEWNNKDPFYDRDLENFRKLHQIGELSIGIIITRGASLQIELLNVYIRFLERLEPFDMQELLKYISLSDNAKKTIYKLMQLPKANAIKKVAGVLYFSKYGAATTHIDKLLTRINRGVGNPCPLILIGIGSGRLNR